MKFLVSVLFILFLNLPGANAQVKRDSVTFPKHIQQELGINYDAFYTFGHTLHYFGTYHPLRFDRPITNSFELTYGIHYRHYFAQALFSSGKTRFYQTLTENIDSSGTPINTQHHADAFISDTMPFKSFNIMIGISGKIAPRLKYSFSVGTRREFYKSFFYTKIMLMFYKFDSATNTTYYSERIQVLPRLHYDMLHKTAANFNFKYKLTNALNINLNFSFNMGIGHNIRSTKEDALYDARFWFYNLNGDLKELSYGRAISNFTQLHAGIGLSYVF